MAASLDLRADPIALTAALVDIPSESRDEARIAVTLTGPRGKSFTFVIRANGLVERA